MLYFFIHLSPHGHTIFLLYFNDMIITGDDPAHIQSIKVTLQQQFEMKDLSPLKYSLGIKVA